MDAEVLHLHLPIGKILAKWDITNSLNKKSIFQNLSWTNQDYHRLMGNGGGNNRAGGADSSSEVWVLVLVRGECGGKWLEVEASGGGGGAAAAAAAAGWYEGWWGWGWGCWWNRND